MVCLVSKITFNAHVRLGDVSIGFFTMATQEHTSHSQFCLRAIMFQTITITSIRCQVGDLHQMSALLGLHERGGIRVKVHDGNFFVWPTWSVVQQNIVSLAAAWGTGWIHFGSRHPWTVAWQLRNRVEPLSKFYVGKRIRSSTPQNRCIRIGAADLAEHALCWRRQLYDLQDRRCLQHLHVTSVQSEA